jgi:hypothetical protein
VLRQQPWTLPLVALQDVANGTSLLPCRKITGVRVTGTGGAEADHGLAQRRVLDDGEVGGKLLPTVPAACAAAAASSASTAARRSVE